jgi:hypothetical protein
MTALYMQSYDVEKNFHAKEKGYRYAADFKIDFGGAAYATIVVTVLWNKEQKLIRGTTNTKSTVTDAAVSISKHGAGWAVVADIPGEEPWVSYKDTVIRFRKRFTVQLPIITTLIPGVGEMITDLGASVTRRIEVEGYIDVISYVEDMRVEIY